MSNVKTILGIAFVVQIALAGGLYLNKHSAGEFDQPQALVNFEQTSLNAITVSSIDENGQSRELKIEKDGAQWRLPSLDGLAANQAKVTEVLEKLADVQVTWPVASSGSSKSRFEVDDDKYQRKITIDSANGKSVLYLGTSPGYRTVHARADDASEIYSINLATHDFPTEALDWLDKGLLKAEDPTQIKGADFEIVNQDDIWSFAGPQAESAPGLNVEKADELASVFTSIRVTNIAELTSLEDPIELSVSTATQDYTYQFAEKEGTYYAKRSDLAPIFVIRDVDYEKIAGINHNELAASPSSDEKASEMPAESNPLGASKSGSGSESINGSVSVDVSQK